MRVCRLCTAVMGVDEGCQATLSSGSAGQPVTRDAAAEARIFVVMPSLPAPAEKDHS